MLIKEMIKIYHPYQNKHPLSLGELKEYFSKAYNKRYSPSAIRNVLIDSNNGELGYYPSYVRGVYIPFKAEHEQEILKFYYKQDPKAMGRLLSAKLGVSNQAYMSGSFIIFGPPPKIRHIDKLINIDNYCFIENATQDEQEKILKLIELFIYIDLGVELKRWFSDNVSDIESIFNWYEHEYANFLKKINVVMLKNNEEFKNRFNFSVPNFRSNYQMSLSGNLTIISYPHLPSPYDFEVIGILKTTIERMRDDK